MRRRLILLAPLSLLAAVTGVAVAQGGSDPEPVVAEEPTPQNPCFNSLTGATCECSEPPAPLCPPGAGRVCPEFIPE